MDKPLSARQRRPSMARRKKRRIGAFSKRLSFSDLDLRTNAGRFANSIKSDLEAQIGNPSPGQQILIKLVAIKVLRCEMMYDQVLSKPDGGDLQLLQPLLQDAVASDPEEDRSLCHPLGAAQVQAVASEDQGRRETGLTGYAEQIQRSLPTGGSAMETAEHREPYESRGSRTDLGAPGGESPPGDSTDHAVRLRGRGPV
jgi:hypothetical protein